MSKKSKGTRGTGDFLTFLSFLAIMLLGLALALAALFNWLAGLETFSFEIGRTLAHWIERIAIAIALVIPLALSFREARARGTAWFVLWIIAVLLVVSCYILGITLFF